MLFFNMIFSKIAKSIFIRSGSYLARHREEMPMMRRTLLLVGSSLLAAAMMGSRCHPGPPPTPPPPAGKPDLVSAPSPGDPTEFCNWSAQGLIVIVKNQGTVDAPATLTTVTFRGAPSILPTPPIPAGGSVSIVFPIPSGCYRPDCSFGIIVDSDGRVDESNETNNSAGGGVCPG
jgi:hypothetical protein